MVFEPKYTITDKILNNISRIMAGKEIIEQAKLIPKWELKLRKEARIHNAHSSTSIEGNNLTLDQVAALAENKDITAMAKDKDVPRLVSEFLDWLNSDKIKEVNPVILAGIVHYETARIHPFIDGNGRTARLMVCLVLYKRGFDHRRFFALDDFYDENRAAYYAALKTVQTDKGDITRWLEYFSDGVLYSI